MEKIGNMEKTRVPVGEPHWYIDLFNGIDIYHRDERANSVVDDHQWECGNYFNSKEEAEAMVRKLRAVLKGADVIETPSEEELETMVQDSTHEITCGGHDRVYAADGQGKILDNITHEEVADIIRNIAEQLKSKIVR